MKAITFLLSILMLTIALKPCSDSFNSEDVGFSVDQEHDHSEDTDDSCPSLCVCSCCGTIFTFDILKQYQVESDLEAFFKVKNEYVSRYTFDFSSIIWQPPQNI
ncbi:MAG: hypothetical protein V3U92_12770 [Cellulophaga sp.]